MPLTVSPFVTLPKAPTLPHNYATLPSTLPPSTLSSPPANTPGSGDASIPASEEHQLPAYVTSVSGFRAHPNTIIAQNRALQNQLANSTTDARNTFQTWLHGIKERELAEKRRKAPGWLDSEEKMLRPERPGQAQTDVIAAPAPNLMDAGDELRSKSTSDAEVNDLGAQMDRAFG